MRIAQVTRNTNETHVKLSINIDGSGEKHIDTGIPFLDHMIDQVSRHGLIDIRIESNGDLHIDDHHSVEDIGITLGMAIKKALGDKIGISRYGESYVPLDESLSRVVIDCSGRPHLEYNVTFTRPYVGKFDIDLIREFFQGLVNHALITLHIDNIRGGNSHHQCESIFKAFGIALRKAINKDSRMSGIMPSTKGVL
ncbi:imidazoleglycerol-phosphate dehydratase [Candidatus Kinetoplastibacterium blastocrithidii TCC012E]|uniref:Imidazoleglycerol-phosphate dehydratase n=1 Tax=Candidatus Kinetoplastidibacterium blastocrithidiae TCC012E TaxID=1208922 RepID=M1M2Q1_9PROT|nr:imidazoleglycerol-phosphate dehydratase HisB [Candidatus Kinetoplastibacterium blastocrithidii]AFZ83376.1 imidazoleglycerol-phosphate dehydratase [Candidatus Kinetoplastibacterium blastocrithidii (ex Strigomonas culicis)]AGF49474.1 imidazoleglycerol-phosphate dehydratase [Candidatus Kinetoplastibacterium blastocrithidii TCC012E]